MMQRKLLHMSAAQASKSRFRYPRAAATPTSEDDTWTQHTQRQEVLKKRKAQCRIRQILKMHKHDQRRERVREQAMSDRDRYQGMISSLREQEQQRKRQLHDIVLAQHQSAARSTQRMFKQKRSHALRVKTALATYKTEEAA